MAGERERENTLSPLQNGDVRRTHSFLTAWCTSVRPWGSSSGPWGRPESAWSWGERTAQGNAKQFVVLMSGWTLSDIQCCKQVGTLPETHWCAGGNDWSLTSFLPVFSHVMLEAIRNTEHLGLWYNSQQSCLLQMAFHYNVVLDCAEQRVPAPNSFAASIFISCLRSTTVWISSKPKPALWTPQMHFQRLGLFGIFEQNISVPGKKKRILVKIPHCCGGKEGLPWDFLQGKCSVVSQYEPLYLPEFLLCLLRHLLLSPKLHFPLCIGCIFSGILLCCPIPWSMLKKFVWFKKLMLNDLIQIARLVLFGLIMLKMLFPEVLRFFSFLPWCRNSGISWGTGIEFFYHQTYKKLSRRERYFNLNSYVGRNSLLEFRGMFRQKMWQ